MEKVIFLGTGAAGVTKFYNACFALKKGNDYILIDGGGGNNIIEQLEKANISLESIRNIFITHNHIDHIIGIIWFIRRIAMKMWKNQYEGSCEIYASDITIDAIRTLSNIVLDKIYIQYIDNRINLNVVKDRETINILDEKFTFYDIDASKVKQYGFRVDMSNGKTLVCNGDEPLKESNYDIVRDVDFLIHEAFCLDSEKEVRNPHKVGHCTSKDVCDIASQLKVKNLILYHIANNDVENRKTIYINENKDFFDGNLYIPNDLEEIII